MFNLFGRKTLEEFKKEAKETYAIPKVPPISVPKKEQKEFYRVGPTDDGHTTLTMLGIDGYGSMTLTMNRDACKQLIRMLQSTFQEEEIIEEKE